jgi:hypothetical protein
MPFVFNPLTGKLDQTGAAQVNSDWNAISGVAEILNKPTIQTFDQSLNTTDDVQFNAVGAGYFYGSGGSNVLNGGEVGFPTLKLVPTPAFFGNDVNALVIDHDWNYTSGVGSTLIFARINGSNVTTSAGRFLDFRRNTNSVFAVDTNGQLVAGSVPDARLSANVPLIASANSFTAGQTITAAANTSALTASYSVTGANTTPLLDLSGTWNTTGIARGILLNITDTASAGSSRLLELQTGGTSRFVVRKDGAISLNSADHVSPTGIGYSSGGLGNALQTSVNGAAHFLVAANRVNLPAASIFGWVSGTGLQNAADTVLARDAANTLAQRNGTNAQTFRLYGTYTDASNGRRLDITSTTGGIFTLTATGNGTGASGNLLKLTQPILLPASSVTLATNGDLAFEATSNTSLTIKYRGSDGTTRSATIALI